jgi:hypothetical protein
VAVSSIAVPNILQDPGYWFWAPPGTAAPTHAVTGSKFTDSWPVAYIMFGATEDGGEFNYETNVEAVRAAEFLDPIKWATTDRSGNVSFTLIDWTLTKWKMALNAPSANLTVVSGTTTTQLNQLLPVTPGAEVRATIGWESLDGTARLYIPQAIQGGAIKSTFKKAPDKAGIACTWNFEISATDPNPFRLFTAGTGRV